MNTLLKITLAVTAATFATQVAAKITFYENENFTGKSVTAEERIDKFSRHDFNDRASSAQVLGDRWEICEDAKFKGQCVILRPGRYPSLASMGLNNRVSSARAVSNNARIENHRYAPAPVAAQITFYEHDYFQGRNFATETQVGNFRRYGFDDRVSSVVVVGDRWEVCQDADFNGQCAVLRPGRYPALGAMGLNNRVSSARAVSNNAHIENHRYAPAPVAAQITFYEHDYFQGRNFATETEVGNFRQYDFNDRASSVVVVGDRWEVCQDADFNGRCTVLRPGRYPSLAAMGLNNRVSSARVLEWNERIDDNRYAPAPASAQATFYERQGFAGKSFTTTQQIVNLRNHGFNDRASSVEIAGDRWEVCEDARFGGQCMVLRPGRYPSLAAMGLNNSVSSVRIVDWNARIDDGRYAPSPVAGRDYRRRQNERLYEANVTSVRAVVGTPEQRCWVEREQVAQEQSKLNVPAAIIGGILGGILGHQVGGGSGKDIATAGGAVAGAVVGSQIGRGSSTPQERDVQRCENVPSQAKPDYWDVTYNFRGQEHRVQMTSAPGSTITVNSEGEPRS